MKKLLPLLLIFFCSLMPATYAAVNHPYQVKKSNYFKKPYGYWRAQEQESGLGKGIKNLFLGWTEIFTEPVEAAQNGDNVLLGTAKGFRNGVVNTVDGLFQTVTLGHAGGQS